MKAAVVHDGMLLTVMLSLALASMIMSSTRKSSDRFRRYSKRHSGENDEDCHDGDRHGHDVEDLKMSLPVMLAVCFLSVVCE